MPANPHSMSTQELLMELYGALERAFGHRAWWPAETPFEVMVGAVLTQNTNWANVEKAIEALKRANALCAAVLTEMDQERLQCLVRPAGYFRQKAARLQRLAAYVVERAGGDPSGLDEVPTEDLRDELLALRGIGPETADSILLYALGRPTFVVDTYTMRIAARHGLVDWQCGYFELKEFFEGGLPAEVELLRDYHAQLVELGKRHCRRRSPRCEGCPARPVLGEPSLQEGA